MAQTLGTTDISDVYKKLVFSLEDSASADLYTTNTSTGDDRKITTLVTALTFSGLITASAGVKTATIYDSNGNEGITVRATDNAVNYFRVTPSATGNTVTLDSQGDDTNIDLTLSCKGTGDVTVTPLLTATADCHW